MLLSRVSLETKDWTKPLFQPSNSELNFASMVLNSKKTNPELRRTFVFFSNKPSVDKLMKSKFVSELETKVSENSGN